MRCRNIFRNCSLGFYLLIVTAIGPLQIAAQSTALTISGTVTTSDSRLPLAGVTINVKGQRTTVITDNDGHYTIQAPTATSRLVFSYVGFLSREEAVNGRTTLNVVLTSSTKNMDDIVVIGYNAVRRKDLTGAVSSINAKQLKDIPVNSAAEALTGRLAGVQITSSEGRPGSDFTIKIRGGGSITQDNSPLYIVDGIQVEDALSVISPQDIETIDVLKDASATAVYGARGANGVVIITTKGGRNSKTTITYNGLAGVRKLPHELDVMDPYNFVLYQYERSRGISADSASFADIYGNDLQKYKDIPAEDWQKNTFGHQAFMQTHNVSISGGDRYNQFNLSLTSNDEDGIMINSALNRKLVSFKYDHTANDKFKTGLTVRYINQVAKGAGSSDEGVSTYNSLRHSVKYRPFNMDGEPADDYDPAYYDASNQGNGLGIINPVLLNNAQYRRAYTKGINIGGYVNYTFNKYLSFKATAGIDNNNLERNSFDDTLTSISRYQGAGLPMVGVITANRTIFNNSNVFTFSNAFRKEKHVINVLLGNEFYNVNVKNNNNQLRYYPLGISAEKALGQLNLGATTPLYPQTSNVESKLVSFFTQLNYAFRDKYMFTFSARADGSSKFAADRRWGYFPSGAIAWRISQEKFMDALVPLISDLKLRVSYGQVGNNRIGDYLYLTSFTTSAQYGLNDQVSPGYASQDLANKNLKWETTTSRNIGIDIALFKSRLQLTADLYRNTTNDLLINVPISTVSGYTTQLQNVGATSNKGIELQLNAVLVRNKNFSWTSGFNISFNRNRIEKLSNRQSYYLQNSGFGVSGQPADYIVQVGQPVGAMYGYVSDGFYKVSDFDYDKSTGQYTLKSGVVDDTKTVGIPQPGWMKLKDVTGDNMVDDNDRTIIGNANPRFTGGFNQQLSYKNFDLSVFVNFVYGNKIFNANKVEFTNAYGRNTNMLAMMQNRWKTIDNDGNVVQKLVTVGGQQVVTGIPPEQLEELNKNASMWIPLTGTGAFYPTSWAMEDGSFLRINNITVGYTLPAKIMSRAKIARLRIYATVNNLAVLTSYSGYDPEVNTRRATPVTPGVDYAAYPRSRAFIAGLNLSL
ncbi:SusC/RagA family protein [Niastella yeongjuensis]|uniref:SusC/RagA family protein n=1 Tax=Niastella yeongjuensis TaxID=354355 RepID=A0A1V9E9C7_9BACT|nr:TonB-dependent receptor [Niastella yeongjuensis]OQP42723.1 SusC/RagA family protein [Niastella yeongjuensis]SEO51387.1 TonB-linked outer membrane protein, SusC/RagA family [Niastella yeongjuensis]